MANATIDTVDHGVDSDGIKKYLDDIQVKYIDDTITELSKNYNTLETAIDSIWQGNSANTFKGNMNHDLQGIIEAIKKNGESLKSEINNIGVSLLKADDEIVKGRY